MLSFLGNDKAGQKLWRMMPLLAAGVIIIISIFSCYNIDKSVEKANHEHFLLTATEVKNALRERFLLYEESLRGGLGLFYASKSVERDEWQLYVSALDVKNHLPGINGIGYIDMVKAEDVDVYLEEMRKDGVPYYHNHPKTEYDDKFVIRYIEPIRKNVEALGLDIGFEANRREAAERARDTGKPALTRIIRLVQDDQQKAGFLLLIPVYEGKVTPKTLEERREKIQGWVYAPFIGSNFHDGLASISGGQVSFVVYDGYEKDDRNIIYQTDPNNKAGDFYKDFEFETVMQFAGRPWTISWYPSKQFKAPQDVQTGLIAVIIGGVFALFLFFTLKRLVSRKEEISREVEKRTKEIQELADFQNLITSNIPDYVFVKDAEFKIVEANEAFFTLYPESMRERVIGYTTIEDYDAAEAEAFLEHDRKALKDGYSETEETLTFPDGKLRTLLTKKVRFENPDGEVFILGIARDITEFKESKSELEYQTQLLLDAEKTAKIGHWRYDLKTEEIYWSDQIFEIYGISKEKYSPEIGSAINFYHPDDQAKVKKHMDKCVNEGKEFNFKLRLIKPGSQMAYVQSVGKPQYDKDGNIYAVFGVFQDITERVLAEKEILEMNKELQRSNDELERFAYIASHDLQEPLRKISGFTDRFAKMMEGKLDDKAQTYMNFITDGTDRMRELVMGLLAYSRVTTNESKTELVNTTDVVNQAIDDLSELVKENNAVIKINKLPDVHFDKAIFIQLFQNLIGNAIKYRRDEDPKITIKAIKIAGAVKFAVSDNGMGMEAKHLDRIFDMFQRLHRKEEISGTGIGLSLCQKIIEKYGGRIWVESELGQGSTFFFTVPDGKQDLE